MNLFAARRFIYNEGPKGVVVALIIFVNALYFGLNFLYYADNVEYYYHRALVGASFPFARAAAACLNLNCTLAVLPVCRNLLSLLRRLFVSTKLVKRNVRRLVDENVKLHMLLVLLICMYAFIHAFSHYNNIEQFARAFDLPIAANGSLRRTLSELRLENPFDRRVNPITVAGSDPLLASIQLLPVWTGVLLCLCLMAIVSTAVRPVRRANFEIFWFTHKLFFAFYVLLVLHGLAGVISPQYNTDKHNPDKCKDRFADWGTSRAPDCPLPRFFFHGATTWRWLLLPVAVYLIEKLLRLAHRLEPVEIVRVVRHPLRVIEIRMRKRSFSSSPGEYVFVMVPRGSKMQWHPYTLTSAPDDPYFSVHIRVLGDWTDAVEKLFAPYYDKDLLQADRDEMPKIYIDGPYGTASEGVDHYSVSVLIACGIGVTPFASILRDLWHHIDQGRGFTKLRKLHFYWICPDYRAFEWFAHLLKALEDDLDSRESYSKFLQIRIHLTGGVESHSVAEFATRIEDPTDSLTGLRAKTCFGRPDWDLELNKMATEYPDTSVGIFFCGPAPLAKQINTKCSRCSAGGSTLFYFNQENF